MSKYKQEYMLIRKRLQNRNSYYNKKYGMKPYKVPKIPKRITKSSIKALTKLLSKTKPIQKLNKKMGLTPTGKIKKSTKNKIRKKIGLDPIPKQTKKKNKYLPKEQDRIIESVVSFGYNLDDIENMLTNMYISSKRGNNTHRANVYDLHRMLRKALDSAIYEEGYSIIAERLKNNAETVEEAIQTIEGYFSDSNEEQLKEAIDKVTELIGVITGKPVSQNVAKSLEDLFTGTMEYYQDGSTAVVTGEVFLPARRNYIDKETGEVLEKMPHLVRFDVDSDTGEILDEFIL